MLLSTQFLLAGTSEHSVSTQNIFISTGELKELNAKDLCNFTVGNREVISYKHEKKRGKLIIKGKKQGYSELIIWGLKFKRKFKIYVLSKLKYLKYLHLTETFHKNGLKTELAGSLIIVEGTLKTLDEYKLIKRLILENEKIIQSKVYLIQKTRKSKI